MEMLPFHDASHFMMANAPILYLLKTPENQGLYIKWEHWSETGSDSAC